MKQAVFYIYSDYIKNVYTVKAARKDLEYYNKICNSISELWIYLLHIQTELRGRYKVVLKFM